MTEMLGVSLERMIVVNRISQYLIAGLIACSVMGSNSLAQEVKADTVSVRTVVGQKFAITFKMLEIDMQAAVEQGYRFPQSIGFVESTYLYEIDAEFMRMFDHDKESGMAKAFEADPLAVRSGESGKTQARGESTEYLFQVRLKVKDDDTVTANITLRHTAMFIGTAIDNIKIQSRLGQPIAFKLSEQSRLWRPAKSCWIIAKVDYAADEKAK